MALTTYPKVLSSPSDGIRVVACPRPFSTAQIERNLPAGGTISEILDSIHIYPPHWADAHVLIGDIVVPRGFWQRVRPKAGQTVTVRVVPRGGGGGKTFLRVIISIAGAVAGFFTGGTALIPTTVLGMSGAAFGGAIGGIVGSLVGMALIPPPKQKSPSNFGGVERSPTVAGAGNRHAPYEPFPKIYGRHRVFPPAQQNLTETR
jgi:hypothetical protein